MKIDMTLREGFPFIRQILADTFHIDAWYFSAPYRDLDKIDRDSATWACRAKISTPPCPMPGR